MTKLILKFSLIFKTPEAKSMGVLSSQKVGQDGGKTDGRIVTARTEHGRNFRTARRIHLSVYT